MVSKAHTQVQGNTYTKYTDGGYSYKNFHTTCTGEKWTSTFYSPNGDGAGIYKSSGCDKCGKITEFEKNGIGDKLHIMWTPE